MTKGIGMAQRQVVWKVQLIQDVFHFIITTDITVCVRQRFNYYTIQFNPICLHYTSLTPNKFILEGRGENQPELYIRQSLKPTDSNYSPTGIVQFTIHISTHIEVCIKPSYAQIT